MVFCCGVPGCRNTSKDVKTHCLPKDSEIRRIWCQALNRIDLINVSDRKRHNFRICDIHFSEDSKFAMVRNRTNLKFTAVPTLYLEGVPSQIEKLDTISNNVEVVEEVAPPLETSLSNLTSTSRTSPKLTVISPVTSSQSDTFKCTPKRVLININRQDCNEPIDFEKMRDATMADIVNFSKSLSKEKFITFLAGILKLKSSIMETMKYEGKSKKRKIENLHIPK
ncbi:uncharacterized protein LOC115879217 [Sitophilus oryzae]|uniref:Uncharacterized protein LOC115879217 n=1 Tax=Sitophilus oryzae TaxID=7048 RepID=A0A6J2XJU8_SITOR|nr:uncharacterized protein LOC115879217 [Sitophilus oryzae]